MRTAIGASWHQCSHDGHCDRARRLKSKGLAKGGHCDRAHRLESGGPGNDGHCERAHRLGRDPVRARTMGTAIGPVGISGRTMRTVKEPFDQGRDDWSIDKAHKRKSGYWEKGGHCDRAQLASAWNDGHC